MCNDANVFTNIRLSCQMVHEDVYLHEVSYVVIQFRVKRAELMHPIQFTPETKLKVETRNKKQER